MTDPETEFENEADAKAYALKRWRLLVAGDRATEDQATDFAKRLTLVEGLKWRGCVHAEYWVAQWLRAAIAEP